MYYGHKPIFIGKMRVRNLYNYAKSGWSWTVEDEAGEIAAYCTNSAGEGLFLIDPWDGSEAQISGTCQFRLTQKTDGGRRAYIRRWFNA